jgi:protein O-mannosyl-transferase
MAEDIEGEMKVSMYRTLKKLDRFFEKKLFALTGIAVWGILVYCNSLTVPFILDDFGSIVNNYAIRNLQDFPEIWMYYSNRFILYLTFAINYLIHGNRVEGYHITNLAIHICSGYVLYRIVSLLLSLDALKHNLASRYRGILSAAAALIFISHPLQVSSVTYIVQRTASLAGLFYFLTVLFYLRYRMEGRVRHFLLTLLFTLLAMYTKENTITIPFLLALLELMFFLNDCKTSWKKRIFLLLLLFLTVLVIPGTNLLLKGYSRSDPHGSFKASTSMDRFHYFYTQMNVILLYIRLLFLPDKQCFDYSNDFPLSKTIWENNSWLSMSILSVIGLFGIFNLRRNKLVTLGTLWFFIGLSVESSFISIKDVYFEHRLYFPMAGFALFLLGFAFMELRLPRRKYLFRKPLLAFILFLCCIVPLNSVLTLKRNYIYSNGVRLWYDTVQKAPNSDRAHSSLATNYLDAYEEDKTKPEYLELAEKEFKKAIELRYGNDTAHTNLSKIYLLKKDYDRCISEAKIALGMSNSVHAYNNMGSAFKKQKKYREAIDAFLAGYKQDKQFSFVIRNLGDTYYAIRDYENSKKYYLEYLMHSKSKEVENRLVAIENLTKK